MTLGPFSYAMIALMVSRLPEEALVWVGDRFPLGFRRGVMRLHARAVLALAPRVSSCPPTTAPKRPLPWHKASDAAVVALVLALSTELTHANPYFSLKLPQPEWLRALIFYPRLTQRWLMFAPNAPTDDGITIVDAVKGNGQHIDPFTGEAPDFDLLDKGPMPHHIEVGDYLFQIHFDFNDTYRRELNRYLEHWHESGGRTPADRLLSYEAWWLSRDTPKPGSLASGPIERVMFAHGRFRR
jgi:hypothetical protein